MLRRARARRPAITRWRCSAPPGAGKACSPWTRTMRWCSRKASRAAAGSLVRALGAHVADILHEVGVPYCKGGVMARNPQWRGSVATWQERVRTGSTARGPQDLLAVDIFFDMRGVHGEVALADALWRRASMPPRARPRSPSCWSKRRARWSGPRIFRRLQDQQGPHRSEARGPVRDRDHGARARHPPSHRGARDTGAASPASRRSGIGGEQDLDALTEAHAAVPRLVLTQQIDDIHERPARRRNAVPGQADVGARARKAAGRAAGGASSRRSDAGSVVQG